MHVIPKAHLIMKATLLQWLHRPQTTDHRRPLDVTASGIKLEAAQFCHPDTPSLLAGWVMSPYNTPLKLIPARVLCFSIAVLHCSSLTFNALTMLVSMSCEAQITKVFSCGC